METLKELRNKYEKLVEESNNIQDKNREDAIDIINNRNCKSSLNDIYKN